MMDENVQHINDYLSQRMFRLFIVIRVGPVPPTGDEECSKGPPLFLYNSKEIGLGDRQYQDGLVLVRP